MYKSIDVYLDMLPAKPSNKSPPGLTSRDHFGALLSTPWARAFSCWLSMVPTSNLIRSKYCPLELQRWCILHKLLKPTARGANAPGKFQRNLPSLKTNSFWSYIAPEKSVFERWYLYIYISFSECQFSGALFAVSFRGVSWQKKNTSLFWEGHFSEAFAVIWWISSQHSSDAAAQEICRRKLSGWIKLLENQSSFFGLENVPF